MDQYRTAESWTGTPGAIAPADGNTSSLSVIPSGVARSDAQPRNRGTEYNASSLDPSAAAAKSAGAPRNDSEESSINLGPNNKRLDDLKPELVNALRELVRQYRQEGIVARRHEIRRIRQARLFWQGLQYAWWNPNDMNWHLPFEQRFKDDRELEEMPRYQFVTNFYQGFGLSFIAVLSQDVPGEDRDPYLYETLVKIVSSVNATSQRAGVDPSTPAPAPSPIASVSVQASNGWFDISVTDPSEARPGLFYFAESDTTPAFSSPRVYFMGASRNLYVQLGNQTLFWRAYSQYIGSLPSAPIAFGAPPTAVAGGGITGPAPLPSAGSGVFPNGVPRGGNGFGIHPGSRVIRQTVL